MATPKTGTLTKIYYSDSATPSASDLTQVLYTEEIPELEEAPEAITYQTVDMEEEYSEQGTKKSTTPAIPVLYTRSQHTSLKEISDSKEVKHWFIKYPDTTCGEGEQPLVKHFTGSCALTGQAITSGDIIKDTLTIYRNSRITETFGFPTTSV